MQQRYASYADAHRTPGNRRCHAFGWPLIGIGVGGILARIPVGPTDLGSIAFAALALSWLLADRSWIALALIPWLFVVHLVGTLLPISADAAILVAGNAIPIAGHVFIEKNAPATLREGVIGTWLGPLFSFRSLLRRG